MVSFLVLYGTGEGQTTKVAERIATVLDERGHDTTTVDAADLPRDFAVDDFDAVLVGASIHKGKHQSAVQEFVTSTRETLAEKPTAFFQISLSSADERGQEQAAGYVDEFSESTSWHPDRIGLFGGALRYGKYGFLTRVVVKQIAKRTLPDVDTSRDVEFTNWNEVDAFAADFGAFVEGRLGVTPPSTEDNGVS